MMNNKFINIEILSKFYNYQENNKFIFLCGLFIKWQFKNLNNLTLLCMYNIFNYLMCSSYNEFCNISFDYISLSGTN